MTPNNIKLMMYAFRFAIFLLILLSTHAFYENDERGGVFYEELVTYQPEHVITKDDLKWNNLLNFTSPIGLSPIFSYMVGDYYQQKLFYFNSFVGLKVKDAFKKLCQTTKFYYNLVGSENWPYLGDKAAIFSLVSVYTCLDEEPIPDYMPLINETWPYEKIKETLNSYYAVFDEDKCTTTQKHLTALMPQQLSSNTFDDFVIETITKSIVNCYSYYDIDVPIGHTTIHNLMSEAYQRKQICMGRYCIDKVQLGCIYYVCNCVAPAPNAEMDELIKHAQTQTLPNAWWTSLVDFVSIRHEWNEILPSLDYCKPNRQKRNENEFKDSIRDLLQPLATKLASSSKEMIQFANTEFEQKIRRIFISLPLEARRFAYSFLKLRIKNIVKTLDFIELQKGDYFAERDAFQRNKYSTCKVSAKTPRGALIGLQTILGGIPIRSISNSLDLLSRIKEIVMRIENHHPLTALHKIYEKYNPNAPITISDSVYKFFLIDPRFQAYALLQDPYLLADIILYLI